MKINKNSWHYAVYLRENEYCAPRNNEVGLFTYVLTVLMGIWFPVVLFSLITYLTIANVIFYINNPEQAVLALKFIAFMVILCIPAHYGGKFLSWLLYKIFDLTQIEFVEKISGKKN